MATSIRKDSYVQINDKATGVLTQFVGRKFKVDAVKNIKGQRYVVLAGIGVKIDAVTPTKLK